MQKIILLTFVILCLGVSNLNAQLSFEGSNDYGRIYDITYDLTTPDRVYALTLTSHLLVSYDNGDTWDVLYAAPTGGIRLRGLKTLGTDSLSFWAFGSSDPADDTVYIFDIATEQIVTQYTRPVTAGATQEWISSYDIYEADPKYVMFYQPFKVGTANYANVYYSQDWGSSWDLIYYNVDYNTIFPNSVAISPSDPEKLFIGRGQGAQGTSGGLFVSEDAGVTWTEKNSGHTFDAIKFHPEDSNIIFAGTGWPSVSTTENLYKSIDGGNSWSIVPITWTDDIIDSINYIEFNPLDSENIIILESGEIAITNDGGTNWTNYPYDNSVAQLYFYGLKASFNPFNDGDVFITNDYYPIKSNDGGVSISTLENPMFTSQNAGVNTSGDGHLYYNVQFGIVHKNLTTQVETANYVEDINLVSNYSKQYFSDPNVEGRIYYLEGGFPNNLLYVLSDHGSSISAPIWASFEFIVSILTDPNDSSKIWVSWTNGTSHIVNTSGGATSITLPNVGAIHFTTLIDPVDSNHVTIGQGGQIYESYNYGTSWTNISNGLIAGGAVYDIKQNPNNTNELIASTNGGIYKSTDAGANWYAVHIGSYIRKIEYSHIDSNIMTAAVYSSAGTEAQLLISDDAGETWLEIPVENIERTSSDSMGFVFESNVVNVYMSTGDLGVVKYEIDLNSLSNSEFMSEDNNLTIYPNPVSSTFDLIIKDSTELKSIAIYDTSGKRMLKTQNRENINVENLSQGVYIVKIVDSNGNIFIKRLIKK